MFLGGQILRLYTLILEAPIQSLIKAHAQIEKEKYQLIYFKIQSISVSLHILIKEIYGQYTKVAHTTIKY
jgi:hypothetical protein